MATLVYFLEILALCSINTKGPMKRLISIHVRANAHKRLDWLR